MFKKQQWIEKDFHFLKQCWLFIRLFEHVFFLQDKNPCALYKGTSIEMKIRDELFIRICEAQKC